MSESVFDMEKLESRMNDYHPLHANHEKRTQEWFKGAGLGLFIHWDHTSEQGIEISWPMVGGVFSLPGGKVVTVDDVNTYQLLHADQLMLCEGSVSKLETILAK
jgi:hypothetical protein